MTHIVREQLGINAAYLVAQLDRVNHLIEKKDFEVKDLIQLKLAKKRLLRCVDAVQSRVDRWDQHMETMQPEQLAEERELFNSFPTFTDPVLSVLQLIQKGNEFIGEVEAAIEEAELAVAEQSTQSGDSSPPPEEKTAVQNPSQHGDLFSNQSSLQTPPTVCQSNPVYTSTYAMAHTTLTNSYGPRVTTVPSSRLLGTSIPSFNQPVFSNSSNQPTNYQGTPVWSTPGQRMRNPPPSAPYLSGDPGQTIADFSSFRRPLLEPLKFKGDPKEWPTFWLSFDRAVHQQPIPAYEKHLHLLKCLDHDSPAHKAVAAYQPSEANYAKVLEILEENFGDTDALRESLRAELYHRASAKNSLPSLRSLCEDVERICLQLSQLNTHGEGDFIRTIIRSKLPEEILLELVRDEELSNRTWDESDLRKGLRSIVKRRERVEKAVKTLRPGEEKKPSEPANRNDKFRHAPPITRAFPVSGQPEVQPPPTRFRQPSQPNRNQFNNRTQMCSLCDQNGHRPSACPVYQTPQQRRQRIAFQKRCFKCLASNHLLPDCTSRGSCWICKGTSHHSLLCNESPKPLSVQPSQGITQQQPNRNQVKEQQSVFVHSKPVTRTAMTTSTNLPTSPVASCEQQSNNNDEPEPDTVATFAVNSYVPASRAHLMTCSVLVAPASNPANQVRAMVLLDPGSQTSYVSRSLIRKLNPKCETMEKLQLEVFGGAKWSCQSAVYKLRLQCADGDWETLKLNCIDKIATEMQMAQWKEGQEISEFPSLQPDLVTVVGIPEILIGTRHFWKYFISRSRITPDLFVIQTVLGPVLGGHSHIQLPEQTSFSLMAIHPSNIEQMPPASTVEEFWSLETIGIHGDPDQDDDQVAVQLFDRSVRQEEDGRYSVRWPWRDPHPELFSNFRLAYSRLSGNLNRLRTMPDALTKYQATIRDQLEQQIIETADCRPGTKEHYLPHHAVITPKKLRVVYDASAHVKGSASLNDCLLRGPVWLPDLAGLLLRFRSCKVPVLADIEKAFLMIALEPEDREVCKFLWVKDVNQPLSTENLAVYRFTRVAFGVVSSPFMLAAVIRHHLRKFGPGPAERMIDNMYVDNLLLECDTCEEAIQLAHTAKEYFHEAQMNLREFMSNESSVEESFPLEDRLGKETAKVLGIFWSTTSDTLILTFPPSVPVNQPVTRRVVLSELATLFDPLGLVGPCLFDIKCFFQELWEKTHGWDIVLEPEQQSRWIQLAEAWRNQKITIQRYVLQLDWQGLELHAFTDASIKAFAATLYIRCTGPEGTRTQIIFSKSRLKPKKAPKSLTIPTMELLGVLLGVRAISFVKKELRRPISSTHLWTDSQIALAWIQSTEPQNQFRDRRLREIRAIKDLNFHFVRTDQNPADIATRGATPAELQFNKLWWNGPSWLEDPECQWPAEYQFIVPVLSEPLTMTVPDIQLDTCAFLLRAKPEEPLIHFPFRSLNRNLRVAAWVLKFINCARGRQHPVPLHDALTAEDYGSAKNALIRLDQAKLKEKFPMLTTDSQGIKRLDSRIGKSQESRDMRCPIVLPHYSRLAKLIISSIHRKLHHAGVDWTLTEFLATYWVPKARRTVKAVISSCLQCRKLNSPKFCLPRMPMLPEDRVQRRRPFESIGLDYLGPTIVELAGIKVKVWIALITCLTVRAVYLEPTTDLSATSFLNVLRRFIARRGCPSKILSDNAPHFVLSSKALHLLTEPDMPATMEEFTGQQGIQWSFIPQLSPWAGGFYERLVALTKHCIQRTLGKWILSYDHFSAFLSEVEASINMRPLTYVSDAPDSVIPLRPVDFIQPQAVLNLRVRSTDYDPDDPKLPPHEKLAAFWKGTQEAAEAYWVRWRKEYLLLLRDKSTWHHKHPRLQTLRAPQLGEIVLVEESFKPRNIWPLGKVIALNGKPPNIRSVQLQMSNHRIWTRPVSRLYPLEAGSGLNSVEEGLDDPGSGNILDPVEPDDSNDYIPASRNLQPVSDPEPGPSTSNNYQMQTRSMARALGNSITLILLLSMSGVTACFPEARLQYGPAPLPPCHECYLTCNGRGVNVAISAKIQKYELCCLNTCWTAKADQSNQSYELSPDILINDYYCDGTFWESSQTAYFDRIQCPAKNECELMDCNFCWDQITNPSCNPEWIMFLTASFLTCMFITLSCVWGLFSRIRKGMWLSYNILAFFVSIPVKIFNRLTGRHVRPPTAVTIHSRLKSETRKVRANLREAHNELHTLRVSRWRSIPVMNTLVALSLLSLLLLLLPMVCVPETIAVDTKSESCRRGRDGIQCTLNFATTLTLLPVGQTNTLLIRDEHGLVLGLFSVKMRGISMTCLPKSEAWLRSYHIQTFAAKRCPRAGSCRDNHCHQVRPDMIVPELQEFYDYPGNTFCYPSTSFWHNGCGLPVASCLYFRWFAKPASSTIYEVVSCSSWDIHFETSLSLEAPGIPVTTVDLALHPGITKTWGNITLAPLAVSLPPMPVLANKFITNGRSVSIWDQKGPVFLHCNDETAASNFNCSLAIDACKSCSPDDDEGTVTCHCADLNLENYLENPASRLPLSNGRLQLRNQGTKILAETSYSPVQLYIQLKDLQLSLEFQDSKCFITPLSLHGCYKCLTASHFSFKCKTDFGNAVANVECSDGTIFAAHCDPVNGNQTVILPFQHSMIDLSCHVDCPAGVTSFNLQGTLHYIPLKRQFAFKQRSSAKLSEEPEFQWAWPIDFQFEWWTLFPILGSLQFFATFLLFLIIGFLLLWVWWKISPVFRLYRLIVASTILYCQIDPVGASGQRNQYVPEEYSWIWIFLAFLWLLCFIFHSYMIIPLLVPAGGPSSSADKIKKEESRERERKEGTNSNPITCQEGRPTHSNCSSHSSQIIQYIFETSSTSNLFSREPQQEMSEDSFDNGGFGERFRETCPNPADNPVGSFGFSRRSRQWNDQRHLAQRPANFSNRGSSCTSGGHLPRNQFFGFVPREGGFPGNRSQSQHPTSKKFPSNPPLMAGPNLAQFILSKFGPDWHFTPYDRSRVLKAIHNSGMKCYLAQTGEPISISSSSRLSAGGPSDMLVWPGMSVSHLWRIQGRPLKFVTWPCIIVYGGIIKGKTSGTRPWRFGENHQDFIPLEGIIIPFQPSPPQSLIDMKFPDETNKTSNNECRHQFRVSSANSIPLVFNRFARENQHPDVNTVNSTSPPPMPMASRRSSVNSDVSSNSSQSEVIQQPGNVFPAQPAERVFQLDHTQAALLILLLWAIRLVTSDPYNPANIASCDHSVHSLYPNDTFAFAGWPPRLHSHSICASSSCWSSFPVPSYFVLRCSWLIDPVTCVIPSFVPSCAPFLSSMPRQVGCAACGGAHRKTDKICPYFVPKLKKDQKEVEQPQENQEVREEEDNDALREILANFRVPDHLSNVPMPADLQAVNPFDPDALYLDDEFQENPEDGQQIQQQQKKEPTREEMKETREATVDVSLRVLKLPGLHPSAPMMVAEQNRKDEEELYLKMQQNPKRVHIDQAEEEFFSARAILESLEDQYTLSRSQETFQKIQGAYMKYLSAKCELKAVRDQIPYTYRHGHRSRSPVRDYQPSAYHRRFQPYQKNLKIPAAYGRSGTPPSPPRYVAVSPPRVRSVVVPVAPVVPMRKDDRKLEKEKAEKRKRSPTPHHHKKHKRHRSRSPIDESYVQSSSRQVGFDPDKVRRAMELLSVVEAMEKKSEGKGRKEGKK